MKALVAGSVLLDIIATFDEQADPDILDQTGTLDHYRIGGTAYNIARNLQELGIPVEFFTYLKANTFSTVFFSRKLEKYGLLGSHVHFDENLPEGAFVAHRRGKEITNSVTSTLIEHADIKPEIIAAAMKGVDMLVMDASFSETQMRAFIDVARSKGKPIIVGATSDSKVLRLRGLPYTDFPIDAVLMNRMEFNSLARQNAIEGLSEDAIDLTPELIRRICCTVQSKYIVVTLSEHGMAVLDREGTFQHFPAHPKSFEVTASVGAGDAVTAVIAAHRLKHRSFDWEQINRELKPQVLAVLRLPGATSGSEALQDDMNVEHVDKLGDLFRKRLDLRETILLATAVLSLVGSILFEWGFKPW